MRNTNINDGDGKTLFVALRIFLIAIVLFFLGFLVFNRHTLAYKIFNYGWKISLVLVVVPCIIFAVLVLYWLVRRGIPFIFNRKTF